MVMNGMVHQRLDSGVSSSLGMQKKNPKGNATKAPASHKQVSHMSRKSQNHLQSNDSKNGDQVLLYANTR